MTRIFMTTIAAVLLALWVPAAQAKTSRAQARKARRLYKQGQRFYKRGSFLRAAESFESGYALDPRPAFLINAAQAYRQAKRPKEALARYRKFLEIAPHSPLRKQVEGLIHDLEGELRDASGTDSPSGASGSELPQDPKRIDKQPPPAFVRPDVPQKTKPTVSNVSSPFYKKWWFWTAVGVVVVGTATGVGVAASSSGGDDYVKTGGLGAVHW